jgi:prepilin-type N-terminal cleavage/methylation domain-containing protein
MKKNKAFSFLELAIVILLVGILVSGIIYGSGTTHRAKLVVSQSATKNSPLHNY